MHRRADPQLATRTIKRADERLIDFGATPLREGLTPHSMRRTFASLLFALGVDPVSVMAQIGHTDARSR